MNRLKGEKNTRRRTGDNKKGDETEGHELQGEKIKKGKVANIGNAFTARITTTTTTTIAESFGWTVIAVEGLMGLPKIDGGCTESHEIRAPPTFSLGQPRLATLYTPLLPSAATRFLFLLDRRSPRPTVIFPRNVCNAVRLQPCHYTFCLLSFFRSCFP